MKININTQPAYRIKQHVVRFDFPNNELIFSHMYLQNDILSNIYLPVLMNGYNILKEYFNIELKGFITRSKKILRIELQIPKKIKSEHSPCFLPYDINEKIIAKYYSNGNFKINSDYMYLIHKIYTDKQWFENNERNTRTI